MTITRSQHLCSASRGSIGAAERIRQDDVIYEVHKEKNYIVYATKEKLLKSLVDPRTGLISACVTHYISLTLAFFTDMEYITQYLTTHLWHTTPGELLDRLIAMYLNSTIFGIINILRAGFLTNVDLTLACNQMNYLPLA
jgi:hypothetical protein